MMSKLLLSSYCCLFLSCIIVTSNAFTRSEQGIKTFDLPDSMNSSSQSYAAFAKSLFKNAIVSVKIHCVVPSEYSEKSYVLKYMKVGWVFRRSPCAEEYSMLYNDGNKRISLYYSNPEFNQIRDIDTNLYKKTWVLSYDKSLFSCPGKLPFVNKHFQEINMDNNELDNSNKLSKKNKPSVNESNRKRNVRSADTIKNTTTVMPTTTMKLVLANMSGSEVNDAVAKTDSDGIYIFVLSIEDCQIKIDDKKTVPCPPKSIHVEIELKNTFGYLSAIEFPLLPFYGSMCILYVLFGVLWLIFSFKYWKEMLRIQFCISGVILLGMLEKALFYAEYQSINYTGLSVKGVIIFAELVSCVKRSVARILVLIVALGYGIVKPRLGNLQHKVIGIGAVFFIFSAIESTIRCMRPRFEQSKNEFYATIPLAVTDAIICWWIFSSLVQTIRNLRVRRNVVKLSLYRHFTNTLIFCVLSSVAFMIWTIGRHKFTFCITAWKELWVDEAFWHLLFSVILFVIIILWRPSQNNQRYAFSPLLDPGEDESDDEIVMDNLSEGMKSRKMEKGDKSVSSKNGSSHSRNSSRGEDDLRWVEDNIPSTLVESTLPSLLQDSDEEIVTTKYEMSKMQ